MQSSASKDRTSEYQLDQMLCGTEELQKSIDAQSRMSSNNTYIRSKLKPHSIFEEGSMINVNTITTQGTRKGSMLKKSNYLNSGMLLQKQMTNQSNLRNQENIIGNAKLIRNIKKQAKQVRKEKKRKKRLDRRSNTLLKRGQKMGQLGSSIYQKNNPIMLEADESTDEEEKDDQLMILEQQQHEQDKDWLILMPDSLFKQFWDLAMLFLVLEQSLVVPYQLCFKSDESNSDQDTDLTFNILFMMDIVINFNSGYYDKGLLILKRKKIVFMYLKSWFCIDVISSIPYSQIFDKIVSDSDAASMVASKAPKVLKMLKIFRFLRILKLLRIFKLQKIMMAFEEVVASDSVLFCIYMFKIMATAFFIAHWMACFYWAVGVYEAGRNANSWIKRCSITLIDDVETKQYVDSLYWALQTMMTVGYGDLVTPVTTNERIFVTSAMVIGVGVYTYVLNYISKMVSGHNFVVAQYREKMMYVNQFMIQKKLPKELRTNVRRYLEYVWENKKEIKVDQEEVFAELNDNLKEKITVCMNGMVLQTIPFLENFNLEFIGELTFHTKHQTFSTDENIFIENEKGDKLFYILQGRVAVLHRKTLSYLDDLIVDDYFGEIAFFTQGTRCATVKSRDFTDLFFIDAVTFLEVAGANDNYGDVIHLYYKIQAEISMTDEDGDRRDTQDTKNQKRYQILKLECYICKRVGHIALDCEFFDHKKGNLVQIYNKVTRSKTNSMSTSMRNLQLKMQMNASGPLNKNTPASKKSRFMNLLNKAGSNDLNKSRNDMDLAIQQKNSDFSSRSELVKKFQSHNPSKEMEQRKSSSQFSSQSTYTKTKTRSKKQPYGLTGNKMQMFEGGFDNTDQKFDLAIKEGSTRKRSGSEDVVKNNSSSTTGRHSLTLNGTVFMQDMKNTQYKNQDDKSNEEVFNQVNNEQMNSEEEEKLYADRIQSIKQENAFARLKKRLNDGMKQSIIMEESSETNSMVSGTDGDDNEDDSSKPNSQFRFQQGSFMHLERLKSQKSQQVTKQNSLRIDIIKAQNLPAVPEEDEKNVDTGFFPIVSSNMHKSSQIDETTHNSKKSAIVNYQFENLFHQQRSLLVKLNSNQDSMRFIDNNMALGDEMRCSTGHQSVNDTEIKSPELKQLQ